MSGDLIQLVACACWPGSLIVAVGAFAGIALAPTGARRGGGAA